MSIFYVVIIGMALAMDAFGVILSIGVNTRVNRKQKIEYLLSFAFFQFLLTFIGGVMGYYFDTYIVDIPEIIGGIIIALVGIIMIIDGTKQKEESILTKNHMCIILGISVSIDALVIGFTAFHHVGGLVILLVDSILIGLITLLICTIGFFICRYIRKIKFISKYADYLGGIALILFAIKMLFF